MDLRCILWIIPWLLIFFLGYSAAYNYVPADVQLKPSDRYYTVWEGESQQIDCYVTDKARTIDLLWEKQHSPTGNYTVDTKIEDNTNGTFTIHSIMKFKAFISSDAGIYKCSYSPQPGYGSENSIKLLFHERCEAGKYGIDCSSSCSEFCNKINTSGEESPCSYKDGHCLHGCLPGYMGATCSSACEVGKYGLGCSSSCSEFCKVINTPGKESPCSYKDGHCLHGCLPGYQGATCSSVCELGKYGPDCSLTCSEFCKGNGSLDKSWCHPETGSCVDGCQDGYNGKFCTTAKSSFTADIIATVIAVINSISLVVWIIYSKRKTHNTNSAPKPQSSEDLQFTYLDTANDISLDEAAPLNAPPTTLATTSVDAGEVPTVDNDKDVSERLAQLNQMIIEYGKILASLKQEHSLLTQELQNRTDSHFAPNCGASKENISEMQKIFVEKVDPYSILPLIHKYDARVLTRMDKKRIYDLKNNTGRTAAAVELFTALMKYRNWWQCLDKVLWDSAVNLGHVMDEMKKAAQRG